MKLALGTGHIHASGSSSVAEFTDLELHVSELSLRKLNLNGSQDRPASVMRRPRLGIQAYV